MERNSTTPEVVQPGMYTAKVVDLIQHSSEYGLSLRFVFKIVTGEFAEHRVSGFVPASLQNSSKLYDWLTAMNVDPSQIQEELDPKLVIGNYVKVVVVVDRRKPQFTKVLDISSLQPKSPE